jgi:hypothetical protein
MQRDERSGVVCYNSHIARREDACVLAARDLV